MIVLRRPSQKAKAQGSTSIPSPHRVKKYTEVKELDAEIIRALVERIDVFKPEKVPGTRTKKADHSHSLNFIGAVNCPRNRKNRHSRISPNYADIFQGIKSP